MGTRRDQFDDLLDGALKQYGTVEPRTGLEGRVLARLAASPSPPHIRWAWAMAVVTAVVVILSVWIGTSRPRAYHQKVAVKIAPRLTTPHTPPSPSQQTLSNPRSHPRRSRPSATVALAAEPALQHFPSPRPMSEQELMLVEYVEHYPKEAILIAKEQEEFQKRVEQAEKEAAEDSISAQ
jgi:hypothetical protein